MEKETKAFLGAMSVIWMGYGGYCFINPRILETFCGLKVSESHPSTVPEIQAMYGGLQFSIGLQAFLSLLDNGKDTASLCSTLKTYALVMLGLGISRALAMVQQGTSQVPSVSMKVLTEGIGVLLPKYYNQNATWLWEIPGGLLAYYLMRLEQKKINLK